MLSPRIGSDGGMKFGIERRFHLIPTRQVELLLKYGMVFMNGIQHLLPHFLVTIHILYTSVSVVAEEKP